MWNYTILENVNKDNFGDIKEQIREEIYMLCCTKQLTESQQQDYQQQIKWKYPDLSVLKNWAIDVRNYDPIGLDCFYVIANLLNILFWIIIFLLFTTNDVFSNTVVYIFGCLGYSGLNSLICSVCFSSRLLVYRFTNKGFEITSWDSQLKPFEKLYKLVVAIGCILLFYLTVLIPKIFLITLLTVFFVLFILLPLISAIRKANNEEMCEQQKNYKQLDFEWDIFTEILLNKKRHVITLFIDVAEREKRRGKVSCIRKINIFCYPEHYQTMIKFIQSEINPNAPCKEGRVKLDRLESGS